MKELIPKIQERERNEKNYSQHSGTRREWTKQNYSHISGREMRIIKFCLKSKMVQIGPDGPKMVPIGQHHILIIWDHFGCNFWQWVTKLCAKFGRSRIQRMATVPNSFIVLRCMWKEPAPLFGSIFFHFFLVKNTTIGTCIKCWSVYQVSSFIDKGNKKKLAHSYYFIWKKHSHYFFISLRIHIICQCFSHNLYSGSSSWSFEESAMLAARWLLTGSGTF